MVFASGNGTLEALRRQWNGSIRRWASMNLFRFSSVSKTIRNGKAIRGFSKSLAARPIQRLKLDRGGRHPGFPSFNAFAGGPGSFAERSAQSWNHAQADL